MSNKTASYCHASQQTVNYTFGMVLACLEQINAKTSMDRHRILNNKLLAYEAEKEYLLSHEESHTQFAVQQYPERKSQAR